LDCIAGEELMEGLPDKARPPRVATTHRFQLLAVMRHIAAAAPANPNLCQQLGAAFYDDDLQPRAHPCRIHGTEYTRSTTAHHDEVVWIFGYLHLWQALTMPFGQGL